MNRDARSREIEMLLLTMLAAAPLYLTNAVSTIILIAFHLLMAGILLRVRMGLGPELIPAPLMRAIAIAYIPFYVIDAALISRSAIGASTHLVLFIAVYQPVESLRQANHAQRLLTTALIFIASLGTSTHIGVIPFVVVFAFVMFRQLMFVSHVETARSLGIPHSATPPPSRAALFYLVGTLVIGAALFPFLPRLRNPFIRGGLGQLSNATTGLSETINFNEQRTVSNDATVVARVWMSPETTALFTPLRLRGAVYDRVSNNQWSQTRGLMASVRERDGAFRVARPIGPSASATVQQKFDQSRQRLFLPVGTHAVTGVPNLFEGPPRGTYQTIYLRGNPITYEVRMARRIEPLQLRRVPLSGYPVTPEIDAMARRITGDAKTPEEQAARIEQYLLRNFEYVANPASLGRKLTTDEFLLRTRRGHCEHFAAGMVALLTVHEVPARIAGGFYGGQFNPMGGYFIVRREDAHAWVEVWSGSEWRTFDPTPPALRPGGGRTSSLAAYFTAASDAVNYFWDRYVLTYGINDQLALFTEAIARVRQIAQAMRPGGALGVAFPPLVLTLIGAIIAATLLFFLVLRRRSTLFDALAGHLERLGIHVGPAMTMEEALQVLRASHPEAAGELAPLIALYEAERFSASRDRGRVSAIRRRLAELRT